MVEVEVLAIGVSEWQTLAHLRLRALADAPHALLGDHSAESGWTARQWQDEARSHSWFRARLSGQDVGLGRVAVYANEPRHLESMWVDPTYRKSGVGSALVHYAESLVRSCGDTVLGLWVFEDNNDSRAVYEALGYRLVDRPYAPGPDGRTEREFLKRLDRSA